MTDPKKMAGMAMELLPPPDRLKRKPPAAEEGAEGEADSGGGAGPLAMGDVRKALASGDDEAAFAALERAVEACNSGGGYEGE